MKNVLQTQYRKRGGVSVALLLISFSLMVIIGSYLTYSGNNMQLTYRSMDYQQTRILSQSAVDAITAQLTQDVLVESWEDTAALNTLLSDGSIIVEPDPIGNVEIKHFEVEASAVEARAENGREYDVINFVATAAVENAMTGTKAAYQEKTQLVKEYLSRYFMFFDQDLDLNPDGDLTLDGTVRCNEDILLLNNGSGTLKFEDTLEAAGEVLLQTGDHYSYHYYGTNEVSEARKLADCRKIKVQVDEGYEDFYYEMNYLDHTHDQWDQLHIDIFEGQLRDSMLRVPKLKPRLGGLDNHLLIEPPDVSDSAIVAREKIVNQADLRIRINTDIQYFWYKGFEVSVDGGTSWNLVYFGDTSTINTNGTYSVKRSNGKFGEKNVGGDYEISNGFFGFTFDVADIREQPDQLNTNTISTITSMTPASMGMIDIYLDALIVRYPGVRVVSIEYDKGDVWSTCSRHAAVRLRNASDLTGCHSDGLTIVTEHTLYIEGDYNTVDPVLSMIAADNVTLLSTAWDDANSATTLPIAGDTEVNAAILTGTCGMRSKPYIYTRHWPTGGADNLVRFREDWSGKEYEFNGSYISLWYARDSWCYFEKNGTYVAPDYDMEHDERFLTEQPPGMPVAIAEPERVFARQIKWEDVGISP